jgi:hypothetical protein
MGPETCHVGCEPRVFLYPSLDSRVTTYHFRRGCRHLREGVWFVLAHIGLMTALLWLLITRRLDPRVSGWGLLGSMARRALRCYRLPGRVARSALRHLWPARGARHGTTV